MTKTITIPRAVLELHRLTSPDEHRRNINHLYLSSRYAIATDGHHLARLDCSGFLALGNETIFIPKNTIVAILKGANKDCVFEVRVDYQKGCLVRDDRSNGQQVSIRFDFEDIVYPDVDQVIPKDSDVSTSKGQCGLSFKLLSQFYSYLKAIKAPEGGLFKFQDELSPVSARIETVWGLLTYVLMPIRTK